MNAPDWIAEPWLESSSFRNTHEQALEFNWCAWSLVYGDSTDNLEFKLERDCVRVITGLPVGFLNLVTWSDFPPAATSSRVEEITASIRLLLGQNARVCEWGVLASQPHQDELREALLKAGWRYGYEDVGMTFQMSPEYQCEEHNSFKLRRVRTAEQVAEWLIPFMEAFWIPSICRPYLQRAFTLTAEAENHPFRHFLMYENGRPVTAGSIQFRYGVAVIYNITTIPEARGLGAASAMVRYLGGEAQRAGYSSVSLFASEAGRGVYEKLGYVSNQTSFEIYQLRE